MSIASIIFYSILTLLTLLGFLSVLRNTVQYARRDHNDLNHLMGVSALFFFMFMGWMVATAVHLVNFYFSHFL
jgi:hypothetical protein